MLNFCEEKKTNTIHLWHVIIFMKFLFNKHYEQFKINFIQNKDFHYEKRTFFLFDPNIDSFQQHLLYRYIFFK